MLGHRELKIMSENTWKVYIIILCIYGLIRLFLKVQWAHWRSLQFGIRPCGFKNGLYWEVLARLLKVGHTVNRSLEEWKVGISWSMFIKSIILVKCLRTRRGTNCFEVLPSAKSWSFDQMSQQLSLNLGHLSLGKYILKGN